MLGFRLAKVPLVDVAVGQFVFDEEVVVDFFGGKIEPPKIAFILVGTFLNAIDDAQVNVVSAWRGHTGEVAQAVSHRLVESMLATAAVAALLNAGAEVELLPSGRVRPSEIIARLKMVAAREIELPHVLAHGMTPFAATDAKADVV